MNLYKTDCRALWYDMKRKDKELKHKRRWLMGLSSSKSEQKQLKNPKFLDNRSLPESLLREDDLFYETIKRCVEEAYGGSNVEGGQHMNLDNQVVDLSNISLVLTSCLDDMTNKGLYHIAMILTGGSDRFENTRWKMKKVIKENLNKISECQNQNNCYIEIVRQVSQLLSNSHYFRQKSATFFTEASHSQNAAFKMLDGLEDLPFQTLVAMHRKIRRVPSGTPQLIGRRSGWTRDLLINQVRKTCEKMLSTLGEGDELQEPLAKAMAVAGLSLKLSTGFQNSNVTQFRQFSPEIATLHNEIAKAIWLIKNKVRYQDLKRLHLLLDPDAKVSKGSLRSAIKKLLTEYLFDCDDMDNIPKSLLETLAIVNRRSRSVPYKCFPKEEVEKEVECILGVSAQTKQIVLDLLPHHEYDQDFTSAYMEDLEESDDEDGDDDADFQQLLVKYSQSNRFQCNDSQSESIRESNSIDCKSLISTAEESGSLLRLTSSKGLDGDFVQQSEVAHVSGMELIDPLSAAPSSIYHESGSLISLHNTNLNQYQVESKGESGIIKTPAYISSLHSASGRLSGNSVSSEELECDVMMDSANSPDPFSSNFSCGQENFVPNKQNTCKKQYLAIQELCDDTSMIAYRLIGRMLKEYARIDGLNLDLSDELYLNGNSSIPEDSQEERMRDLECMLSNVQDQFRLLFLELRGDESTDRINAKEKLTSSMDDVDGSFIVRVVEELIPSFSKSGKEKLKKLTSLL